MERETYEMASFRNNRELAGDKGSVEDYVFLKSQDTQELSVQPLLQESRAFRSGMEKGLLMGGGGALLAMGILVAALVCHFRKKEENLKKNLELDAVTGLGNKLYLKRCFRQKIREENRTSYYAVFFYTDTERMMRQRGTRETEEFLRRGAKMLRQYTADTDILARAGEDGIVLFKHASSPEKIRRWMELAFKEIDEERRARGDFREIWATAGVYPLKAADWDEDVILLEARRIARAAHERGQNFLICDQEIERQLEQERALQAEVKRALEEGEFTIYLHFYVRADTFQVIGAEALSRWNHPTRGFLEPDSFIGLMEKEGMISQLDFYGLDKVCAFLERIFRKGTRDFFISCNFSRQTFSRPDFTRQCREIIEKYEFPREMLVLELTESVSAPNVGRIYENMVKLRQYGVRIMLDDFGEGFATFSDLRKYPVSGVKLSKSLVDDIKEEKGQAILQAVVQVGRSMELMVLAEGVEDDEQVHLLQEMDCDIIQGYKFYYPVPEEVAEERIAQREGRS